MPRSLELLRSLSGQNGLSRRSARGLDHQRW